MLPYGRSVSHFMPDTQLHNLAPHREHFRSSLQAFEAVQLRILEHCVPLVSFRAQRTPSEGTQYSRISRVLNTFLRLIQNRGYRGVTQSLTERSGLFKDGVSI